MVSAVIEGIFEFIIELIFRLIIEVLCFYTGEIVLSIITFGKKKVQWDYYSDEAITKWMLITELSTLIGVVFWISIVAFVSL